MPALTESGVDFSNNSFYMDLFTTNDGKSVETIRAAEVWERIQDFNQLSFPKLVSVEPVSQGNPTDSEIPEEGHLEPAETVWPQLKIA